MFVEATCPLSEVCGIDVEYLIDGKDLFVSIY